MKKILITVTTIYAAVFIAASSLAGGPTSFGVGAASIKILPTRQKTFSTNITQWVMSNSYAQGQIIQNSNRFYMVMNPGTNTAGTSAPTHMSGEGNDGVLTYYKIPSGLRKGFAIVNDSAVDMNLAFGVNAVSGKGVTLKANGGAYSLDNDSYQGPVFCVAQSSGSNSVSATEVD